MDRKKGPTPNELLVRGEGQEWRVERLGRFNAERARGLLHTPEWIAFMESEQEAFNRWAAGNGTFEWEDGF